MKRKKGIELLFAFAALFMAVAMFNGCGSKESDSAGTGGTTGVEDAAWTGNCTICHTYEVHTSISGIAGVNTAALGRGSAITHECEACHGGGQYHHGEGPIPYPSPGGDRCETCHEQATKVLASKHNALDATNTAMTIAADEHYLHGYCQRCHSAEGSIAFKDVVGESSTISDAIVDHGEPIVAPATYEALEAEDAAGNVVLHNPVCGACHNALTKELVTVDAGWDPNQNGVSDQFDLCTSCHNYQLNSGQIFGSGENGTAEFYHNNSWYRIIPTTHYDDPATGFLGGTSNVAVEGYVIRKNSANPCFDCHGHELYTNTRYADDPAELTIHTMWAKSGHAGGLIDEVVDAVAAIDCNDIDGLGTPSPSLSRGKCNEQVNAAMAAFASDASSNGGYTHYDWDATLEWDAAAIPPAIDYDRGSCQMCHTSTGFMNYVADPAGYLPEDNDFSHLSGWSLDGGANGATISSPQNELLYCWGCHSNAEAGTLRVQGAVTATYTYGGSAIVFPDSGSSNTCYVCHGGRGNNETVSTSSRFAGHHAPAAATLFNELTHVGGEYAGRTYTNVPYFAHDGINVDGAGPCASCHMSGETPNHEFAVVEKDNTGVITGIVADVCVTCHDGEHALFVGQDQVGTTQNIWNGSAAVPTVVTQAMADAAAAELEHESESYQEAGQLLLDIINQANGLTNHTAAVISQANASDDDRRAFQNSKLTGDEKGGFAHNRYYVKRLIFDSIDWAENGALDGTINDYTALGTGYQYPNAMTWLGTSRPGGL